MKISFVLPYNTPNPTGGYKVVYEYANYLVSKSHDVNIYYISNKMGIKYNLPKFFRIMLSKLIIQFRPRWFKLDKRIKKIGIFDLSDSRIHDGDVVVATAVTTSDFVYMLASSKGKKFYFIQGFESWNVNTSKLFETYSYGMTNIVVSKWLKEIVDEYSEKKSILISNGIDTKIFNVKVPIEERNKYNIVFHYRSNPLKGCEYGLKTIRILEKQYDRLKVFVISNEKEPENLPKCCEYIRNANSEKVAEINNNASIFMCTSIEEGFGLPGLEGCACGCALVSTNYPAVHEYAKNGVNSLLSPIKDPEAMANNIRLLISDDSYRIQLAKNASITGKERSLDKSANFFEKTLLK